MRLNSGDIHRYDSKLQTFQKVKFLTYDMRLELSKALLAIEKKMKDRELSVDDIREKMKEVKKKGGDTTSYEVEIHKRYAIPFTCIVFALIGVPLGIQPRRSGRSYGFVLSLLILLAYYIFLTASEILAMRKTMPPLLAGWTPNLLLIGFGIYLFVKAANESPSKSIVWLTEALDFIQRKWKGLIEDV